MIFFEVFLHVILTFIKNVHVAHLCFEVYVQFIILKHINHLKTLILNMPLPDRDVLDDDDDGD